ncbi:MAG: hypothetical protein KGN16_12280 [Burkholderiales bacterium]|nr:hypothetical protein [Burkholderiales bacterium]
MKWVLAGVVLALVATLAVWRWHGSPPWPAGLGASLAAQSAALHKCLAAGRPVLYTADACPAGSREAAVQGAVTVLPAAPQPAAAAASAPPHVRDRLVGPDPGDLRDKRMDAIIGR